MKDRFVDFDELSAVMREGYDYQIACADRESEISIVAPHGGKIELGTSVIAKMIASDDFNFYAFEGIRKSENFRLLHITSHNFNEPTGLEIAEKAKIVIGIHGRSDDKNNESIYLSGLDLNLIRDIKDELSTAGFLPQDTDHPFPATNPFNICNRGISGRGAQLEFSNSMRKRLIDKKSTTELIRLSGAVRNALFKQLI